MTFNEMPGRKRRTALVPVVVNLAARFQRLGCVFEGIDAAKCAESQGQPGWYCFAVEFDQPRQLNPQEEWDVHEFKFGLKARQEPSLFREDTNGNE